MAEISSPPRGRAAQPPRFASRRCQDGPLQLHRGCIIRAGLHSGLGYRSPIPTKPTAGRHDPRRLAAYTVHLNGAPQPSLPGRRRGSMQMSSRRAPLSGPRRGRTAMKPGFRSVEPDRTTFVPFIANACPEPPVRCRGQGAADVCVAIFTPQGS